jgi:signal peptidase I
MRKRTDPGHTEELKMPSLEILEQALQKEQYKHSFRKSLGSTIGVLVIVAAVAVLIAVLVLPVLQITGTSMTDTLQNGDVVVGLTSTSYQKGDVVAFYYNNSILVKRVIATAGDWVDIDEEGNVSVNGELLDEPYVTGKALGDCDIQLPYQVPEGRCFLMGDHRSTSVDSRNSTVGCIENDMIVGKLIFRVWPLSGFGTIG